MHSESKTMHVLAYMTECHILNALSILLPTAVPSCRISRSTIAEVAVNTIAANELLYLSVFPSMGMRSVQAVKNLLTAQQSSLSLQQAQGVASRRCSIKAVSGSQRFESCSGTDVTIKTVIVRTG